MYKLDSLPLSDYGHITTSCYETHTLASEYVTKTSQVSVFYNHNFNPKSATDLYLRFKHIYDRYRDRKYLITEFLPKCLGLTLSVGCHHYNRFDCYCLPNPKEYKTIDINKSNEIFGSPFGHTTIDFLKLEETTSYSNIILYGVLGIPTNNNLKNGDKYTLFDNPVRAFEKANLLLKNGGTLLLGPDLNIDKSTSFKYKLTQWTY